MAQTVTSLLGLHPANKRPRYKVMSSPTGWCKPRISLEYMYIYMKTYCALYQQLLQCIIMQSVSRLSNRMCALSQWLGLDSGIHYVLEASNIRIKIIIIAYLSRLPWIFLGVPLKFNEAYRNIQGNLTTLSFLSVALDIPRTCEHKVNMSADGLAPCIFSRHAINQLQKWRAISFWVWTSTLGVTLPMLGYRQVSNISRT